MGDERNPIAKVPSYLNEIKRQRAIQDEPLDLDVQRLTLAVLKLAGADPAGFWGSLTVTVQDGNPSIVKIERTVKLVRAE